MRFRLLILGLLGLLACRSLEAAEGAKSPRNNLRLLMVTQSAGFRHSAVTRPKDKLSVAERAVVELGISSGAFRADCTQDVARDLTKERLGGYDLLLFYTTGDLPIDPAVRDYLFTDWVKRKGHGFVGVHSAADTYHNYEPYWEMLGGTFDGHPWNYKETVAVKVHDPEHPVAKPWGTSFEITDEIYKFKHWQPEKVRVLMSLDMAKTKLKQPYHVPIAWVKQYGDGRVFHMSLGHREDVWANPKYLESLLRGIKWCAGVLPGDATPNPDVSRAENAKAKAAYDKSR